MGGIHPYYRRKRPAPQSEDDFLRDLGLLWMVRRLMAQGRLPAGEVRLRALMKVFPPEPQGSVRALLANMLISGGVSPHIDLLNTHMAAYGEEDPLAAAHRGFDKRAAAAIFAAVSPHLGVRLSPIIQWRAGRPFHVDDTTGVRSKEAGKDLFSSRALLEMKYYGHQLLTVYLPTVKSLAAMAFADYFPGQRGDDLRKLVSDALIAASPGWCGTFGPAVDTLHVVLGEPFEGNYDMAQQHLLRTAYAYFGELSFAAREHLTTKLLARGQIHRVSLKDTFTSGGPPNDWSRAGFAKGYVYNKRIGETENHILMINTTRYLANQLMYQRYRRPIYDNRRNGSDDAPSSMDLLLYLLRNILRNDFSEYNAKSYQHETRTALLNLFNFAYDHEVRLAARMALDYVSAHMAVSSDDCRRMVPFRRRNEGKNVARTVDGRTMTLGLTEWQRGADPMTEHMAMLTGATRAYQTPAEPFRPFDWSIAAGGGESTFEVLSDYRMPAIIHDLFVTDLHRRFYQVLNRRMLDDVEVTGHNATGSEMFAASPSYLITAGGSPATFAIDPYVGFYLPKPSFQDKQRGVAMPTSFMPTGESAGNNPDAPEKATVGFASGAVSLIQLGGFAQRGHVMNYGAAPDFLCGPFLTLPAWCRDTIRSELRAGKFDFVNKRGPDDRPGFYLAILRDGDFAAIEAFDTWLHPELTFETFRQNVLNRNQDLGDHGLRAIEELTYTTENGNRIRFLLWNDDDEDGLNHGAYIINIDYGGIDRADRLPDVPADRFLRGAVLNSPREGVVEISNPFLSQKITLDMSDQRRPRRISELNEIEAAGDNQEVWVDFDWPGTDVPTGDFFRPFRTLREAFNAVADGGVVKIVPGATAERGMLGAGKRLRLQAPIGGVTIGRRPG